MARDIAAPTTPALTVSGEVIDLPLDLIEVRDRLRPINMLWASALGRIMTAEGGPNGNFTPIWVCRLPGQSKYRLVAGGHRLEGAHLESWETIRAIVISADAMQRRRAEVSENLWGPDLSPIDRAAFVAELIHLQKVEAGVDPTKDGRSVSAKARWSETLKADAGDASATIALAYGWADETADQIGLSRRSIYNDLELHRGLKPDVVEKIRALPVAKNAGQLRALAKLPEAEQRAVAGMIIGGEAKSVTDALAMRSQKPTPDPQKKAFNAFVASWGRMGAKERRLALAEIAKIGLPTGVTLDMGGRADG